MDTCGESGAFRQTQLSWVWKMNRLLPGRQGGRGVPAEEKQRQRHGGTWRTVYPGISEELGLTREDVQGLGEAQGRQTGRADQKATKCQAAEFSFLWHTSQKYGMFPFLTETLVWALERME